MKLTNFELWWGPPKKFSNDFKERKVSWLELFYDLVYVIAISKTTHHLSDHLNISGLIDYTFLFIILFWGWLNGSLHHDMHGSTGLRTNLLTLWQMMIVAALVVTFNSPPEVLYFNITIAVIVMQIYITYIWWSVGIYDKNHRKLNKIYTICYLSSFALMLLSLFVKEPFVRILFCLSLVLNYLPPFLVHSRLKKRGNDFSFSASMTERMGLFTIIVFGEVMLGVINGVESFKELGFQVWVNFGLAVLIVFGLWWIFFSMIADRTCKKGFLKSSLMSMVYIPTLMSLGIIGVTFSDLFHSFENAGENNIYWIKVLFGVSISIFLLGIVTLTLLLNYGHEYLKAKSKLQVILSIASILFLLFTFINFQQSLFSYLLVIFTILLMVIIAISKSWLSIELRKIKNKAN